MGKPGWLWGNLSGCGVTCGRGVHTDVVSKPNASFGIGKGCRYTSVYMCACAPLDLVDVCVVKPEITEVTRDVALLRRALAEDWE